MKKDVMYSFLNEYERKALSLNEMVRRLNNGEIIFLKGLKTSTLAGRGLSLKINNSIGLSSLNEYNVELKKLNLISELKNKPDIMMDLSILKHKNPLYERIKSTIGCPVGTLPHYICFNSDNGIDDKELLDEIERQAESGVSFMTFHFTANLNLLKKALKRKIPIISRGGSIILRDMVINNRTENVLIRNFYDIIKILKKYNVVLSVGTTYRPSSINDALDEVQLEELAHQKQIVQMARKQGLSVMLEGIGHASISQLERYIKYMRKDFYVPFMPIGPIISDRTYGWDHITSAIGATFMAYNGGADIINSITREEHTGGVPSSDSIIEAICSAQVVVKAIDDVRFSQYINSDGNGQKIKNCLGIESQDIGCNRCKEECPFKLIDELEKGNYLI